MPSGVPISSGLSPIKTKDEHVTMKVKRLSKNACREKASSRLSISKENP